jgi:type III secretion protein V
VEIGSALIPLAETENSPLINTMFPEMRARIRASMGVNVPGVRVRGNQTDFGAEQYVIILDEIPLVLDKVCLERRFSPAMPDVLRDLGVAPSGILEAINPLSGTKGSWVSAEALPLLERHGVEFWPRPEDFMVRHLEAVLRQNLIRFVGLQEVEDLLEEWGKESDGAALIAAALPDRPARLRFARLLRALVKEGVPLTSWRMILEVARHTGLSAEEISPALREVRVHLKEQLPGNESSAARAGLAPELETMASRWIRREAGKTFYAIPAEETQQLLAAVRELQAVHGPNFTLIVRDAELRPYLRRVVELEFPRVMVLSEEEQSSRSPAAPAKSS